MNVNSKKTESKNSIENESTEPSGEINTLPEVFKNLNWNGCWEDRIDRVICRWMVVWKKEKNDYIGCIGGYSGGGVFQLEKFILNENSVFLDVDPEFSDIEDELLSIVEDCQDLIMYAHDEDIWFESDNLILLKSSELNLKKDEDTLYGGISMPEFFSNLFHTVGLISSPSNFNQEM